MADRQPENFGEVLFKSLGKGLEFTGVNLVPFLQMERDNRMKQLQFQMEQEQHKAQMEQLNVANQEANLKLKKSIADSTKTREQIKVEEAQAELAAINVLQSSGLPLNIDAGMASINAPQLPVPLGGQLGVGQDEIGVAARTKAMNDFLTTFREQTDEQGNVTGYKSLPKISLAQNPAEIAAILDSAQSVYQNFDFSGVAQPPPKKVGMSNEPQNIMSFFIPPDKQQLQLRWQKLGYKSEAEFNQAVQAELQKRGLE